MFTIVPGSSATGSSAPAGTSLNAAIQRQIAVDRQTLARVNKDMQLQLATAKRAQAEADAATATAPIAAEDLVGRSRAAAAADAAHAALSLIHI